MELELLEYKATFLIILLCIAVASITVYILFLYTLQRTLQEISEGNRLLKPGYVWFMLIPLFGLLYAFAVYPRVSDSLIEEFGERKMDTSGDFARNIGIAAAVLAPASFLPFLGNLAALAHLVVWIIFWAKINQYKNQLIKSRNLAGVSLSNNPDLLD